MSEDLENLVDDYEDLFHLPIPTQNDIDEAADGLIRTQEYYDLYCDEVKL